VTDSLAFVREQVVLADGRRVADALRNDTGSQRVARRLERVLVAHVALGDRRARARVTVVLITIACVLPSVASAGGYVFQFAPTNPRAGSKYITVRAIPTPPGYEGVRVPDTREPHVLDLYLIRHVDAPSVHSVRDSRLIPLGRFSWSHTWDHARFRLPHLHAGSYAMAPECVSCKPRAFHVIGVGIDEWGIAPLMLLHASAATGAFPIWPFAVAATATLSLAATGWIVVRRHRRSTSEREARRSAATTR
jgi:hypothetical protein